MKVILIAVVFLCVSTVSCKSYFGIKVKTSKPKSDLKIEYSNTCILTDLDCKIIDSITDFFKNEILLEVHLEGSTQLKSKKNYLQKIQVLTYEEKDFQEIQLYPIFQKRHKLSDKSEYYRGENDELNFVTNIQIKVSDLQFGENRIKIKSFDNACELEIFRRK